MFEIVGAAGFAGPQLQSGDRTAFAGSRGTARTQRGRDHPVEPPLPVMPAVRFRVLGPVRIEPAGVCTAILNRRQASCLLAVLLLEAGNPISLDRLINLLWDGSPPPKARPAIRCHVARIRAMLSETGTGDLRRHRDGYELCVNPLLVDAHQFTALLERADREHDLLSRDRLLRHGLSLWRGPALAGAASDLLHQRIGADLEELRLYAIEEAAATSLALGHDRRVIIELTRLVGDHPYRERLLALYMLALHQAGRTADALRIFQTARRRLADDLGLDPGPILQRTHQVILSGGPPDEALWTSPRRDSCRRSEPGSGTDQQRHW